jgi:hypothetical protein
MSAEKAPINSDPFRDPTVSENNIITMLFDEAMQETHPDHYTYDLAKKWVEKLNKNFPNERVSYYLAIYFINMENDSAKSEFERKMNNLFKTFM